MQVQSSFPKIAHVTPKEANIISNATLFEPPMSNFMNFLVEEFFDPSGIIEIACYFLRIPLV